MTVERFVDSVLYNVEVRGLWVSGRLKSNRDLFVEFSFEDADKLPNRFWIDSLTPIICLNLFEPRHAVAEFLVGRWYPRPPGPDVLQHLAPLILSLRTYRPEFVTPAPVRPSYLS